MDVDSMVAIVVQNHVHSEVSVFTEIPADKAQDAVNYLQDHWRMDLVGILTGEIAIAAWNRGKAMPMAENLKALVAYCRKMMAEANAESDFVLRSRNRAHWAQMMRAAKLLWKNLYGTDI